MKQRRQRTTARPGQHAPCASAGRRPAACCVSFHALQNGPFHPSSSDVTSQQQRGRRAPCASAGAGRPAADPTALHDSTPQAALALLATPLDAPQCMGLRVCVPPLPAHGLGTRVQKRLMQHVEMPMPRLMQCWDADAETHATCWDVDVRSRENTESTRVRLRITGTHVIAHALMHTRTTCAHIRTHALACVHARTHARTLPRAHLGRRKVKRFASSSASAAPGATPWSHACSERASAEGNRPMPGCCCCTCCCRSAVLALRGDVCGGGAGKRGRKEGSIGRTSLAST